MAELTLIQNTKQNNGKNLNEALGNDPVFNKSFHILKPLFVQNENGGL